MMLHRPPTSAALRAREKRARRRDGVEHDLRVRVPTRRLVAALRAANPGAGPLDTRETLEAELASVVEGFINRWVGNKPNA
jgi:hypothetical protein